MHHSKKNLRVHRSGGCWGTPTSLSASPQLDLPHQTGCHCPCAQIRASSKFGLFELWSFEAPVHWADPISAKIWNLDQFIINSSSVHHQFLIRSSSAHHQFIILDQTISVEQSFAVLITGVSTCQKIIIIFIQMYHYNNIILITMYLRAGVKDICVLLS